MQTYWIEESGHGWKGPAHNSHGNPWFVFTRVYSYTDMEIITISIPYHAYKTAYFDDIGYLEYEDHDKYPQAWDEWLSYTINQRREYIREFRRNNKKNMNTSPFECRQEVARQLLASFVTFPQAMPVVTQSQPTQENTMNTEFYTERNAAKRVVRDAQYARDQEAQTHFHIRPDHPKTLRELFDMIDKKQHQKFTDKELDARHDFSSPWEHIEFRKHEADTEGFEAYSAKHKKALTALHFDIDTLEPKEFNPKVHKYLNETLH